MKQNPKRAAHYFAESAEQGDSSALGYLGQMYLLGEGVAQNNETAFEYGLILSFVRTFPNPFYFQIF